MLVALSVRRILIVLTTAAFSRSTGDSAHESHGARQDLMTFLAGSRITQAVHFCRRVPWANRRLIHLTKPSFTQEA
jgi:hypothetical protein